MKQTIRAALILTLITLTAGICLSVVYQITAEPIARAEQAAALEAYGTLFPDLTVSAEAPYGIAVPAPKNADNVTVEECLFAYDGDECRGFAIRVTSGNGYGGDITLAVGVDMDGKLTGISVLSQSETAGLGANCEKKSFTDGFIGISDEVVWTKTGKTRDNEIDALSGATVTTRAVTEAVNAALAYALILMEGGTTQ